MYTHCRLLLLVAGGETHIQVQMFEKGFVLVTEDGVTVPFQCAVPSGGVAR